MEVTSLKTASTYINNLLLARGLVHDGEPIPFEHVGANKGRSGNATMAKIMNLIHDLILRRDREQSHHATLTTHLQTLRTEASQSTARISRLESTNDTLTRQLTIAETTARNAQVSLKSAENSNRGLEKELAKARQKVGEIRRTAEKDIRKRDEMVKGLKGHLSARQRGSKVGLVGASVTITPGSTGSHHSHNNTNGGTADVADPAYSLNQETTGFLTQLSQSLSDENDGLIALIRGAVNEIDGLLGIPGAAKRKITNGQQHEYVGIKTIAEQETTMVNALPTSYEALAADIEQILSQLRDVLTSPNFVPLEEVEVRDEEIGILRHGWERMEARWREAVAMMEGWRKRMEEKGDTIQLADLKVGLGLGEGLGDLASVAGSARKRKNSNPKSDENSLPERGRNSHYPGDEVVQELGKDEEDEKTANSDMFNLEPLPRQRPLRETSANIRSPRRVSFMPSLDAVDDENTSGTDILAKAPDLSPKKVFGQVGQAADEDAATSPNRTHKRSSSPHPLERASKLIYSSDLSDNDEEQEADDELEHENLTVHDKLRAVQAEAEAAAEARAKKSREQEEEGWRRAGGKEDAEGAKSSGARSPSKGLKRTRIGGRPKRRKSTLTPDELMGLLGD